MTTKYRYLSGERLTLDAKVDSLLGMHTPYCWGCGSEAEQGLGVVPRLDGTSVVADLEFARRFEGGPGTVHGGAIAAFMDDLLGYVPVIYGAPRVTAKLDTNFISPVPIGVTVHGTGWISRIEGAKLWAEGTIELNEKILAETSALFVEIDSGHYPRVLEGFTEEQLERLKADRSGYYP
jgi:acyl-coenzyme A thioesterase PaaI-like protein